MGAGLRAKGRVFLWERALPAKEVPKRLIACKAGSHRPKGAPDRLQGRLPQALGLEPWLPVGGRLRRARWSEIPGVLRLPGLQNRECSDAASLGAYFTRRTAVTLVIACSRSSNPDN